jgi:hypothetical protein
MSEGLCPRSTLPRSAPALYCTLALLYKNYTPRHALYPYLLHSRNYNFSGGPRRKKRETKKATEGGRQRKDTPIPSHPSPHCWRCPPPPSSPLSTPTLRYQAARVAPSSSAASQPQQLGLGFVPPRLPSSPGQATPAGALPLHSPVPLQPPITLSPTHSFLPPLSSPPGPVALQGKQGHPRRLSPLFALASASASAIALHLEARARPEAVSFRARSLDAFAVPVQLKGCVPFYFF